MPTSESTPLQGKDSSGSLSSSRFLSNLLGNSESLSNVANVAQARLQDVQEAVKDGNFSLRLMALLGGLGLVVASVFGFLNRVLSLNIFSALIELYTCAGGFVILILEARLLNLPERFLENLYKYALFLKFVWGRGCLYFIVGTLQFMQGNVLDIAVGSFVMLVGALYIHSGRQAAEKLKDIRKNLYSEQTLRSKFEEADRDGDGGLTKEEFETLITEMGVVLNRREVEAAYLHLSQDTGSLTFNRFRSWFADGRGDDLIV